MSRLLRDAFSCFATGCTVVTTRHNGTDIGMTCSSFSSVSLDPALVLWSIRKEANCIDAFIDSNQFAISVLSSEQSEIAMRFATGEQSTRFSETKIQRLPSGLASIADNLAVFDCTHHQVIDSGDHYILIGEVNHFETSPGQGLLFERSQFGKLTPLN